MDARAEQCSLCVGVAVTRFQVQDFDTALAAFKKRPTRVVPEMLSTGKRGSR